MILGIDTTARQCAVALIDPAGTVCSAAEGMDRGHAEALFPMIERLLDEAACGFDALTRIGVCTGPGSFTGVRIGVAAARGLALGRGIPAVGITRLEALAGHAAMAEDGTEHAFAVAIAMKDLAAFAAFAPDLTPLAPPALVDPAALADLAPAGARHLGDGWPDGLGGPALADAAAVARLARRASPGPRPAPLYLRAADAAPPREAAPQILDG